METNGHRKFVTTAELAEALDVSRDSVLRWVKRGHIPAIRPTPRSPFRFDRELLELATPRILSPTKTKETK